VNAGDPTASSIADRAAAGAVLTVSIEDDSAPYLYSEGVWSPEGEAVEFPGYGNAAVKLSLGNAAENQDGSAAGLLSADVLAGSVETSPTRELRGVELSHSRTLIEVELDGELTIDAGTDVLVDDAVAYNAPDTDRYEAIVDAGVEGFNVTLTTGGIKYVIWTSRTQVTGEEFKAGYRYRLSLTNVGMAVELRAITLSEWGESGGGTARQLMEGTIDLGSNYTPGTTVKVTYASGAANDIEFDDLSRPNVGSVWGIEGDVIESIAVGDGPEILIGRAMGDDIVLALNDDLTGVTLRQDDQNRYLVGSYAELRLVDGEGMAAESFLQEADIYLMSIPWTPLFVFTDDDASSNFFEGTYDGGGHKLHDIFSTMGGIALFHGNDGGTIKNVHLASGRIGGRGVINNAGICVYNRSGTIENCANGAQIEVDAWAAGVCVINQGTVTNCHNFAQIGGYGSEGFSNIGGVVAINGDASLPNASTALVENCTNNGLVYGMDYVNGGIAGTNWMGAIRGCVNNGEVRGEIYVAGIAGTNHFVIENCTNNGTVTGEDGSCGGIAAQVLSDIPLGGSGEIASRIRGCTNNGAITSKNIGATGGIIASAGLSGEGSWVENCVNTGTITGNMSSGGIAGGNTSGAIRACINSGIVVAIKTGAGGIAGDNDNLIVGCVNTSTSVSASDVAGGITGANGSTGVVSASYSTGAVTAGAGRTDFGGITGINNATGLILDCFWSGAAKGFGSDGNATQTVAAQFGENSWPTQDAAKNWGIGEDYQAGLYWVSLGGWSAERPMYPVLYFRRD
jgi:hypothetical protein